MDDKTLEKRFDRLEQKIEDSINNIAHKWLMPMHTDIGHLKTDMGTVKGDIKSIKADIKDLKSDVSDLKDGQRKYDQILKKQEIRIHAVEDAIKVKCE